MDTLRRPRRTRIYSSKPPHHKDHKELGDGSKAADVLKHILGWHLRGTCYLKADIIGIFEAHGFERDAALQIVTALERRDELREAYPGGWIYEPRAICDVEAGVVS